MEFPFKVHNIIGITKILNKQIHHIFMHAKCHIDKNNLGLCGLLLEYRKINAIFLNQYLI